jgi:hypothetical protein
MTNGTRRYATCALLMAISAPEGRGSLRVRRDTARAGSMWVWRAARLPPVGIPAQVAHTAQAFNNPAAFI